MRGFSRSITKSGPGCVKSGMRVVIGQRLFVSHGPKSYGNGVGMAIETDITTALFARLQSLVLMPVHPVSWPNVAFAPPAANRWLRVSDLPTITRGLGVAHDSANEYRGLIQVDVFGPLGSGLIVQKAHAGAVAAHFKRGTRLQSGQATVHVLSAVVGPDITSHPRLMIPVTINYRAFAQNA